MKTFKNISYIIALVLFWFFLITTAINNNKDVQEAGVFSTSKTIAPNSIVIQTIYHNGRSYDIFIKKGSDQFEVIRVK